MIQISSASFDHRLVIDLCVCIAASSKCTWCIFKVMTIYIYIHNHMHKYAPVWDMSDSNLYKLCNIKYNVNTNTLAWCSFHFVVLFNFVWCAFLNDVGTMKKSKLNTYTKKKRFLCINSVWHITNSIKDTVKYSLYLHCNGYLFYCTTNILDHWLFIVDVVENS